MALPLGVLAASQAGHLLAWQLRQGPRGLPARGSGVHAYVPALTAVVFGAAAVAILAALSVVAVARLGRLGRVGRQPAAARLRRIPLLDMAAVLFVVQLAVYLAQETPEASWGGQPRPDLADLLLWGSLGQVPAAIAAGAALSWLTIRFEAAMGELQTSMSSFPLSPAPALAPVRVWDASRSSYAADSGGRWGLFGVRTAIGSASTPAPRLTHPLKTWVDNRRPEPDPAQVRTVTPLGGGFRLGGSARSPHSVGSLG